MQGGCRSSAVKYRACSTVCCSNTGTCTCLLHAALEHSLGVCCVTVGQAHTINADTVCAHKKPAHRKNTGFTGTSAHLLHLQSNLCMQQGSTPCLPTPAWLANFVLHCCTTTSNSHSRALYCFGRYTRPALCHPVDPALLVLPHMHAPALRPAQHSKRLGERTRTNSVRRPLLRLAFACGLGPRVPPRTTCRCVRLASATPGSLVSSLVHRART